jgi:hypothetical protein
MSNNKKQIIHERQKNIAIIRRNKQLLKVNVLILSIGLALSYMGYDGIGEPVIWLGIIIFGYTTFTSMVAKKQLKQ